MTGYERGFIDGIKSKVSAELTPTLINVSKTMLETLKPVLSTALENALNDNNAITDTDVQPVYHGEWKYYKNNGIYDIYKCSVCGTQFNLPMDVVPSSVFCYCPHCGKKMIDNTVSQNRCSNYMDCDGSCFIDDTPCDCAGNIEKCKGR